MAQEICCTPKNMSKSSSKFRLIHSDLNDINNHNQYFTPSSLLRKKQATFNLLPVLNTPPARFARVINPFDAALTDRLHLPLIQSPLFHKIGTITPQKTPLHFEWTIDEVSTLGAANFIACDTQFQMKTPDPDLEAKTQEAINSYFNENEIVPSPMDTHLRNNQINLINDSLLTDDENTSEIRNNKKKKIKKCDGIAQTVLTFPTILPKHIEDLLENYFTFTDNQQQTKAVSCNVTSTTIDYDARDASLRRKLFETSFNDTKSINVADDEFDDLEALSPPPQSPDLDFGQLEENANLNSSRINFINSYTPIKRESFGAISPISKSNSPPTKKLLNKLKKNLQVTNAHLSTAAIYRSTPERLRHSTSTYLMEISSSSDLNFSKTTTITTTPTSSVRKFNSTKLHNLTTEWLNDDELSFDDDMQISQTSSASSTQQQHHQQHPTTPLRSINPQRKNLSRSFSLFFDYELQNELTKEKQLNLNDSKNLINGKIHKNEKTVEVENDKKENNALDTNFLKPPEIYSFLQRTDSGFNEGNDFLIIDDYKSNKIENINRQINTKHEQQQYDDDDIDVSMRSINNNHNQNFKDNLMCSTPSKFILT